MKETRKIKQYQKTEGEKIEKKERKKENEIERRAAIRIRD